ncbi:MAG: hypothetical protein ISS16_02330 [Ignavibacteria bacterium]|nr:hypothetical protein [Ignavibacteria bacterium]
MQLHYKFIKQLLIPIIVFFCISSTYSQDLVTVNIQQPPPNQLHIEHLWKITLNNTSMDVLDVYLYGTLTEQNAGLIVTAKTSSINLHPGVRNVNVHELEPITVDYPNPDPRYKETLIRTGNLPGGDYEVCIYVRLVSNNNNVGSDCIQQNIEIMPAPALISPGNGENLNIRPLFTWMQAVKPGTDVRYKIKIVEVKERQSPEIAMQTNLAWFEQYNIMTRVFQYPLSAEEFIDGSKYAWQITSLDFFGNPIGENDGKSEIWSFSTITELEEKNSLAVSFRLDNPAISRYCNFWTFRIDARDVTPRLAPDKLNEKNVVEYGKTLTSGEHTIAFAFYFPDGYCLKYVWDLSVKISNAIGVSVESIEIDEIVLNGNVPYTGSVGPLPLVEYSKERAATEVIGIWQCRIDKVEGDVYIISGGYEGKLGKEGMLLTPDDRIGTGLPETQPKIAISGTYGELEFTSVIDEPIIQGNVRDLIEWFIFPSIESAEEVLEEVKPCSCVCIIRGIDSSGKAPVVDIKKPGGDWVPARVGDTLKPGDKISTAFNTFVLIECKICTKPKQTFILEQLTMITIPEDCYEKGGPPGLEGELKFDVDKMKIDIKKGDLKADLKVSMPNPVAGVRG